MTFVHNLRISGEIFHQNQICQSKLKLFLNCNLISGHEPQSLWECCNRHFSGNCTIIHPSQELIELLLDIKKATEFKKLL